MAGGDVAAAIEREPDRGAVALVARPSLHVAGLGTARMADLERDAELGA